MGIIRLIKDAAETWRIEKDKRRKQTSKYRIEYAFTCAGKKYYRFADIANLPYERGLQAIMVYNELEMRCSRKYLLQHVDAMDKLLHQDKIDIYKINALNEMMKQRLSLITDVDLMYKLASVCYFDETESPETYEPDYADKKIAAWRKSKGVHAFFTQQPLLELMPFLRKQGVDLDTYTLLNEKLNKEQEVAVQEIISTAK